MYQFATENIHKHQNLSDELLRRSQPKLVKERSNQLDELSMEMWQ